MLTRRSMFMAATVAFALSLSLAMQAGAAPNKPEFDRVEGWVQMVDTEQSKISLRIRPNVVRPVFYNDATIFTHRNEPSSFEGVQAEWRVICIGKFDEKGHLLAQRVDVRATN